MFLLLSNQSSSIPLRPDGRQQAQNAIWLNRLPCNKYFDVCSRQLQLHGLIIESLYALRPYVQSTSNGLEHMVLIAYHDERTKPVAC